MYKISTDLDLKEIVDSNIDRICLGAYNVGFYFDVGTHINVEGDITVLVDNQVLAKWNQEVKWTSAAFQNLLNCPVTRYEIPNDKIVQIEFANGLILQLHDSSDQYESFQVYQQNPERMTII